jgi:hypothetical protein
VLYVPNAGHSLRRQDRPQPDQLNHLIDALAAFSRHQISGRPMPNLAWKHESVDGKLRLTIQGTPAPLGARLWLARTPTRDFRGAKWRAEELKSNNGQFVGEATPAATGHLAMFGEVDYEIDGLRYHLSSQLRLTE